MSSGRAHPSSAEAPNLFVYVFLSAFASLADPTSRAYYDRKRAQGKRHNAALICLARRRVDVIYAMLRDRKPYQIPTLIEPDTTPAAA